MKKIIPVVLTLSIACTSLATAAAVAPVAVWKKQVTFLQAQVKKLSNANLSLKDQSAKKEIELAAIKEDNARLRKLVDDPIAAYPKIVVGKVKMLRIPANPAKGFNYSYYLKFPTSMTAGKYLLVESTNTGI